MGECRLAGIQRREKCPVCGCASCSPISLRTRNGADNARTIFDKLVTLSVQPSAAYPNGIADIPM
jgi:hypothetical protein